MSRMTEQDLAHLHESAVAEAAGDAERALAHHEAVRPFPDNSHRVMLRQLVELGDAVPAWGHARWILEQVTRWITAGTVASHRLGREGAIRAAHAIGLDPRRPYGFRVEEFCGLLLGHDWIYRQLVVFEFYGLKDFLELEAGPELVARAGPIHAWAESAMGGFRFEGDGGGRATFTDLSTGTEIDVLDLGCAGQLRIGDCAIGRVVPIETRPGLMFESLPLPVSAGLATRVADNPDRWLMELTSAYQAGRFPPLYSWREQHPLLTDVPVWVWRYAFEDEAAVQRRATDPRFAHLGHEVVGDAVDYCDSMLAAWSSLPTAAQPSVAQAFASAVLHPGVMAALRELLTEAPHEMARRDASGTRWPGARSPGTSWNRCEAGVWSSPTSPPTSPTSPETLPNRAFLRPDPCVLA